jgi:hypothetical protein
MTEEIEFDPEEARFHRAEERVCKVIGSPCPFKRGVKLITKEKRLERAMKWFKLFVRARSDYRKRSKKAIAKCRKEGFAPHQIVTLRRDFAVWKAKIKSRMAGSAAKKGAAKKGRRGRVRSKNDKRLGARSGPDFFLRRLRGDKEKRIPRSKKI